MLRLGLAFIIAARRAHDDHAQHRADNKHDGGHRARTAVVLRRADEVVQIHDDGHGGANRVALAVGQNLRNVEHLQAADEGRDERVDEDGANQRQGNLPERLIRGRAVNLRRLEHGGADAHHRRHQDDGGVAEPHQEVHQTDERPVAPDRVQETDGLRDGAHAHQHRVDRAVVREQREEQHGECRSHDQVGHVDDRLEERLAFQLEAQVGKPGCQQQRDGDLRDKADDPQDQRVAKILGQIGREQGDVVFQTHKVGSDDLQAAAVILKKAVIDGGCQRDQLEYREDDKERCNEDIALSLIHI